MSNEFLSGSNNDLFQQQILVLRDVLADTEVRLRATEAKLEASHLESSVLLRLYINYRNLFKRRMKLLKA
jgi:hypothetical protein